MIPLNNTNMICFYADMFLRNYLLVKTSFPSSAFKCLTVSSLMCPLMQKHSNQQAESKENLTNLSIQKRPTLLTQSPREALRTRALECVSVRVQRADSSVLTWIHLTRICDSAWCVDNSWNTATSKITIRGWKKQVFLPIKYYNFFFWIHVHSWHLRVQ